MAISFECEGCGKPYTLRDELAGKLAQCKQCGQKMTVPSTPDLDRYGLETPEPSEAPAEPMPAPPLRWASKPGSAQNRAFGPPVSSKSAPKKKGFFSFGGSEKGAIGVVITLALIGLRVYLRMDRAPNQNQNQNQPNAQANAGGGNNFLVARPENGPILVPDNLPQPGPAREIEPGVMFREVNLGPLRGNSRPGHSGKIWVYYPSGEHAPHSLPCVLIAPAGSNLVTGMKLADGDIPEHIPYVKAGFAVVAYEIDGAVADMQKASDEETGQAMLRFLQARAGLVNATIALEYSVKKLPEVDPGRISAAGHSSAGTLAVLFAEQEPRLKSCVAFAPATDLAKRFGPEAVGALQSAGAEALFTRYSPITRANDLRCPLMLFHAKDDSNVPVEDSEAFAQKATAQKKSVKLDIVPTGEHYQSMINEGIPHAIAWLNEQGAGPER